MNIDFFGTAITNSTTINIFDIQGKLIKSILKDNIDTFTSINISDLKSGFYILKIKSEDGKKATQKFVIN